jgi:hypothetical protein
LHADAIDCDVLRFERHVREGDAAAALDCYRGDLSGYRGRPGTAAAQLNEAGAHDPGCQPPRVRRSRAHCAADLRALVATAARSSCSARIHFEPEEILLNCQRTGARERCRRGASPS